MDREPFDDPVLGRVSPGDGLYEWTYSVPVGGREARGTIEIEDEPPVLGEPLLKRHRRFVTWLRGHEAAVRDHLVGVLYPDWRDHWYDEEKHPALLTAEEFRAAIGPDWFYVLEDGGGLLYYHDGGLLGSHSIAVSIDADGRLVRSPGLEG